MIAGVIKTSSFINTLPVALLSRYDIRIYDGKTEIFNNEETDPQHQAVHSETQLLPVEPQWRLEVARSKSNLIAGDSPLALVVQILGSIVALMIGASILLWEKATFLGEREKEARHFSQTLSESSIDMIFVTDIEKLAIIYCNKVGLDYLGVTQEELARLSFEHLLERVHPDDVPLYKAQREKYEALLNGEVIEVEIRLRHIDGEYRWLHFHRQVMTRKANGDVKLILGTGHDVTERHLSEEATRQANLALEEIVDRAPIGMALAGLDGSWLRINAALCALLGYSEAELLKLHFSAITHQEDLSTDYTMMEQMIRGTRQGFAEEKRFIRKDGSLVWVLINAAIVRDANSMPLHFICQMQDITDRKRFESDMKQHRESLESERSVLTVALEKAEIESKVDILTGTFNRRWFDEQLDLLAASSLRSQWSLIMVDVDHFKSFNDTFGHSTGDKVLQAVGKVIRENLRGTDAAARYGGEEFVIICKRISSDVAAAIAERIRLALHKIDDFEKPIAASFGVATSKLNGTNPVDVLKAADEALYIAKKMGRDRVCVAEPEDAQQKSA